MKDYNVMIDGKNFFDQTIKNDTVIYENIRKIATGQGDDYTTGCLLDYAYFKNYYKMIAIDLSKQQALDADPKAVQQIDFTANLERAGNTRIYFILEEAQETVLDFSEGTVIVLLLYLTSYQFKMTHYNSLNVKLSISQLNRLKSASAIKNETEVVLRLSSNMVSNSDDETNFLHKSLLTNRKVANLRKAFASYLATDIKLSKTQFPKIVQSGGFLGGLLDPLLKTGLPLMKYVIKPLAKSVQIPLELTAAASAADARIHKKNLRIW